MAWESRAVLPFKNTVRKYLLFVYFGAKQIFDLF